MDHRSVANDFLQSRAMGSLTPVLLPCDRILFSLGQRLDYFNKSNCNTGPEAEICHLFLTNAARNRAAHPLCHAEPHEVHKSRRKGRLYQLIYTYAWMKLYMSPKSGVAAFHSEAHSSGVLRLAVEDSHQKIK